MFKVDGYESIVEFRGEDQRWIKIPQETMPLPHPDMLDNAGSHPHGHLAVMAARVSGDFMKCPHVR